MMPSHRLLVTLLVLIFFLAPLSGPFAQIESSNGETPSSVEETDGVSGLQTTNRRSVVAADPISGVLDPVVVEQYGYEGTGLLNARTDSASNDQSSIPIDNATGWVGSQAELEIWNMERLYAENGTLDDGIPGTNYHPSATSAYPYGWDLDWDDPSSGLQNVSTTYDEDNGYLVLESKAELATPGGLVEYRHWDGTYIYWNQTIHNVPYSDNLTLSFMYNYDSGIIDNPPIEVAGWLWLDVLIDGAFVAYSDLMTECPSRNTWYEFVVPNLLDLPSTFNLQIGISVEAVTPPPTDYFITYPGADYDEDSELDYSLAQINRVFLDNISLLSVNQPSYDEVDLTFNAGVFSTAITEFSNYGTAVITNPSYWTDNYLDVGVSANVSISFDYEVKLLSHHFGNSLWTSQPTKQGVAYTVDAGASAALSAFTYVGNEGVAIYENFTVEISLPPDWENITIFDPFLNDVTGLCTFTPGLLEIPTSILDRLGWWQVTLESPNYAESVTTQIDDTGWTDSSIFRPTNKTRVVITLGTASDTPLVSDPVNVTWYAPDDSTWSQDSPSSGVGGVVYSDQRTLGGSNTTAGEWSVVAAWTNGTEVAYGVTTYDMYHTASLDVPVEYQTVQTDIGLVISNFVYYTDTDTSEYLLDDSVTITANWTGSIIPFTQDLVKNWWRGEFDTSALEGGQYIVVVTASRPYFDDVTTQFTVVATQEMTLEILNAGATPIERGLNEVFTVQMDYELLNGTGISGAMLYVDYSGPGGGLSWSNFNDNNNGHYSVDIICDIAVTYSVTITLNKTYYQSASDSFTLVIGETGTELELINGTSGVVNYGESYRLVVEYRNSTGFGLPGADLDVVSINPATGLTNTSFTPISGGFYEITFTPTTTGTFSITISASLFNHETKFTTFTLTGVVIPTILTSIPSSATVAVNESYIVQLLFQDEGSNPINAANITLIETPSGIIISEAIPVGNGLFNITLRSSEMDVYNLLFRASANNYQSSIVGFTLSVTALQTNLEIQNPGTVFENGLNEVFTLQLSYQLFNGTGVPGASSSIIFSGPQEGLSWTNFTDYNNGSYSMDITCNVSAIYGISVTLSKSYYYNASDSFTLIIGETGSELQILNGTADVVLFGNSYLLVVEYRNSSGSGLTGADLQVVQITPEVGLSHSNFSHITDGFYQITLTPTAAGSFSVVIRASILNHVTQYATFTLTAAGIPTILTALSSSATIALDQNITVQFSFQDESLNPIDLATVVVVNPPAGILISNVTPIGGGLYNFTLTPQGIGSYDLLFRASADNYQSSSAAFTLSATEIPTILEFEGDVSSAQAKFQDSYELIVYYCRADTPALENVDGASLTVLVQSSGLVVDISEHVGYYVITITGEAIGSWSLTISAEKTDHRLATKQFLFQVEEIPLTIEVLDGLQGPEGFPISFRVKLTETETGDPVTGATVYYDIQLLDGLPYGNRESMIESSSEPGVYTASLTMPSADETYFIVIGCNIANFVLDDPLPIQLLPRRDITTMIYMTVRDNSYVFIGLGAIGIGLVYRRSARKRRIRQNKVTLAVKRRFDDVRNLLGVIVLHKDSGLPIYSKILREGLEEAVISAFITAITSFRGEFDIETSTEEWGL
ncbi:MAG: hypothetical protein ACFFEM_04570, partial [Candidatus Thorarchaeota archaeon]